MSKARMSKTRMSKARIGDVVTMDVPKRQRELQRQRHQREISAASPGDGPQQESVGLRQSVHLSYRITTGEESSVIGRRRAMTILRVQSKSCSLASRANGSGRFRSKHLEMPAVLRQIFGRGQNWRQRVVLGELPLQLHGAIHLHCRIDRLRLSCRER